MDGKENSRSWQIDAALGAVLFAVMLGALYMALIDAPRERTMGDLQRIFYFHVPAAIAGMIAFAVNFVASIMYILRKNRRWDNLGAAAAEVGVMFFIMVLVTGSIWAKPVWFVWWTWSPRLTTSLILCMLYLAYLLIRKYIEDPERRGLVSAVFGIIAFADAPLVWFSIRWWRDIHPEPMLESGGLAPAMRPAFLMCLAAFLLLMIYLVRRRFFLASIEDDVEELFRAEAH
ncbi:MAG: cytochrome c biogenesis protein [Acidobacteria bacterium]|nr:cytochrome c biogenesis protein [Acidobacteriota bacterium]